MRGKRGRMSRRLVYYCIGMLTLTTVWAATLKTWRGYDMTDVLTFVAAVFGGELLMLCMKRIFAEPREKDNKSEDGQA